MFMTKRIDVRLSPVFLVPRFWCFPRPILYCFLVSFLRSGTSELVEQEFIVTGLTYANWNKCVLGISQSCVSSINFHVKTKYMDGLH